MRSSPGSRAAPKARRRSPARLRAGGEFAIGTQQFSVERLKFEFDRKTIEGRLAYAGAIGGKPPRLDAELKAAELDVDGVFAFGRAALDGTAFERPRAGSLSMDIRRATLAGIDVKGVSGTLKLDPEGLTFDKVRIADLADATFGLNGRMEGALDAPRGTVTFDVDARGLDGTVAVLDRYFPQAAGPLRRAAGKITPLKTQVTLGIEPASPTQPTSQSKIKLALDGNAGALRAKVNAEATGDIGALVLPDYQLDAHFAAADGTALMALTGLDRAIAVDKRAGSLSVTLRGKSGADAQLDARLTAGGLAAGAKGTARLFSASGLAAALDLTLQAADAGPLRRGAAARATALLPVALRARLNATGNDIALEDITGAVGGTPVRGKLKLANLERIEGQIDTDAADVMALLAFASGMPKPRGDALAWTGEPFGDNAFGDLAGRVDFTAARAALTPALIARQVRGALRLGNGEVAIDGVEGTLAGGRASGRTGVAARWRGARGARQVRADECRRECGAAERGQAGRRGADQAAGRVRGQRTERRIAARVAQGHRDDHARGRANLRARSEGIQCGDPRRRSGGSGGRDENPRHRRDRARWRRARGAAARCAFHRECRTGASSARSPRRGRARTSSSRRRRILPRRRSMRG